MISNRAKFLEISLRVTGMRRIISHMILNPKRNGRYELPPKDFYKKLYREKLQNRQQKRVSH